LAIGPMVLAWIYPILERFYRDTDNRPSQIINPWRVAARVYLDIGPDGRVHPAPVMAATNNQESDD
jgi:hypothetical protein